MCRYLSILCILHAISQYHGAEASPPQATQQIRLSQVFGDLVKQLKHRDTDHMLRLNVPEHFILPVPDLNHTKYGFTICMKNMTLHGHGRPKLLSANINIDDMAVQAALTIDELELVGNYTLKGIFSKTEGPFAINVMGLNVTGKVTADVERDGKLRTQDFDLDVSPKNLIVNFGNLGFIGSLAQSIIDGKFIFNLIKPLVIARTSLNAKAALDEKLQEYTGDIQFTNSIAPFDMVMQKVRQLITKLGFDPCPVKDYHTTTDFFGITLNNSWFSGLSSIDIENVTLNIENNKTRAGFEIQTGTLFGHSELTVSFGFGQLMSKTVTFCFSIEYLKGKFDIRLSHNKTKLIVLEDINLDMGNILFRSDGAGLLDYVLELGANVLPNLLRYQIMEALENTLRKQINDVSLDSFTNDDILTKHMLPAIDVLEKYKNVILTNTLRLKIEGPFNGDDFFNF